MMVSADAEDFWMDLFGKAFSCDVTSLDVDIKDEDDEQEVEDIADVWEWASPPAFDSDFREPKTWSLLDVDSSRLLGIGSRVVLCCWVMEPSDEFDEFLKSTVSGNIEFRVYVTLLLDELKELLRELSPLLRSDTESLHIVFVLFPTIGLWKIVGINRKVTYQKNIACSIKMISMIQQVLREYRGGSGGAGDRSSELPMEAWPESLWWW